MNYSFILLLCLLSISSSYFFNFKFGAPFKLYDTKLSIPIPQEIRTKISNISGFYGLIGPNVNMHNITLREISLYQLFTTDGSVQGIFFDKGNVSYIQHHIQTEKLKYEQQNGKIPKTPFVNLVFEFFSKLRLLPNRIGVANTALLHISDNKMYALYERDLPYELNIDYQEKDIHTIERKYFPDLQSFSGHTKFINNNIETIDYNVMRKSIDYYIFSKNMTKLYKKTIKTIYPPITHDFVSNNDTVLFIDPPIIMDFTETINSGLPFRFDKTEPTYFHLIDRKTEELLSFEYDKGIYIFHHSHLLEDDTHFYLYTCVYDDFSYFSLNIKASYRCIVMNKMTKEVSVIRNEETEKYNLDFPITYKSKTILRNLVQSEHNSRINGFVLCDGLNVEKEYIYKDIGFCGGDPNVIEIDGKPHISSFAYSHDFKKHYFCLIPLQDEERILIELPVKTNIGFHSIFINNDR